MTKERVNYSADGVVLGNQWGGGMGWYPARKYYAETFTKLKNEIKKDFESGAVGALMVIVKHTAIDIKGVCFRNENKRKMWLGKIMKRESVKEEAKVVYYSYEQNIRKAEKGK